LRRATGRVVRAQGLPALRSTEIRFPQLPPAWDGLTIAQISDVHAGPYMPVERMQWVAEMVNGMDPDLILFTGDQMDRHPSDAELFIQGFKGLTAPLGVFGILGNHDHFFDPVHSEEALREAGITPLVNRSVSFQRNGYRLAIVGVDDLWAGGERASDFSLLKREPHSFRICLCHQPQGWLPALAAGAHLTLSGHTHGGQITFPTRSLNVARLHTRYIAGLFRRHDSFLYVSRGIGVGAVPVRVGAPPEVDLITLRWPGVAMQAAA
jgi:predicted MPP superfamily phosphohydrolase